MREVEDGITGPDNPPEPAQALAPGDLAAPPHPPWSPTTSRKATLLPPRRRRPLPVRIEPATATATEPQADAVGTVPGNPSRIGNRTARHRSSAADRRSH